MLHYVSDTIVLDDSAVPDPDLHNSAVPDPARDESDVADPGTA